MPDLAESPPKRNLFTKETASHYGKLGNLIRWHPPTPSPLPQSATSERLPTFPDDFAILRLRRLRDQLDRVDALMVGEKDSKRLKELADASARLSAQEFALAGRPMPGTLRPAAEGARGGRRSRAEGSLLLDVSSSAVQVAPSVTPTEARPIGWEYDPPSEVSPVTVASPPSTPDRLPGDVTP